MQRHNVTLKYFAYGSNLLIERLRARAPSIKKVGTGFINCYDLQFYKRSIDDSGKCTIIPTLNDQDQVYGLLAIINETDKPKLDRSEGLDRGYSQHMVEVNTSHGVVSAFTYVAEHVDKTLRPYTWYRDLVVAGAVQNNFPDEYVAWLKCIKVDVDPDQERELNNRKVLISVK